MNFILDAYLDRDVNGNIVEITNAKCCMLQKCGEYVTKKTYEGLKKIDCPK